MLGQLDAYWSLPVLARVGSSVILGWGSTRLAFSACCSVRVERSRIVGNTAMFQEHTPERVVCVGVFPLVLDVWCVSWHYRRSRLLMIRLQGRNGAGNLVSGILARDSREL